MEIYLDNSATTRVSDGAAQIAIEAMTSGYGNPSSLHRKGFEAEQALTAARAQIARVLAVDKEEIIFTSSGSEANNLAILGTARALCRSGNRIVTTQTEHSSVLGAVAALEKDGFEVVRVPPRADGTTDPAQLAAQVDEHTVLVSAMQVNSETGSINDIATIAAAVRRSNPKTLLHCDCVQGFCRLAVTPRRWGVDMVTVSGHKIHAPKGVAALYRRKGVRLLPLWYGSGQEGGLRPGTENLPAIAAMGFAAEELWQSHEANEQLLHELRGRLIKKISQTQELCINSPSEGALHILSISAPGVRSEVMIHFLERYGIYVSSGSACSKGAKSHVLTAMGLAPRLIDSAIRISLCQQNTVEQMDIAVEKLLEGCRTLAKSSR